MASTAYALKLDLGWTISHYVRRLDPVDTGGVDDFPFTSQVSYTTMYKIARTSFEELKKAGDWEIVVKIPSFSGKVIAISGMLWYAYVNKGEDRSC